MFKKFFTLAIVFMLIATSACATKADQFKKDKDRIIKIDSAAELNDTFREAVEANPDFDEEIVDSYVRFGIFRGYYFCEYCVLTKDDEYIVFKVKDAERIYLMYDPFLPSFQKLDDSLGTYELCDYNGSSGTIRRLNK